MLLIIYLALILISFFVGRRKAYAAQVNFYINRFTEWRFSLGASFKEYKATDPQTQDEYILEILSIGLILVDIEIEFYKKPTQ